MRAWASMSSWRSSEFSCSSWNKDCCNTVFLPWGIFISVIYYKQGGNHGIARRPEGSFDAVLGGPVFKRLERTWRECGRGD